MRVTGLLVIGSLVCTSAALVYGQPLSDTSGRTPIKWVSICHGENAKKIINYDPFKDQDEHGCDDHGGWTVFEGCAGGGANPSNSAAAHCGVGKPWTADSNYPSVSGNNCGYSWFRITCWSGP
jgi:hypothetical protein